MRLGLFTASFLDMELEKVVEMAAEHGYEAIELPAFTGNGHIDVEEIPKGDNARKLRKMIEDRGMIISALSNHTESQLVLGPYGKDTDAFCKGSKEEKIGRAHV